MVNYQWIGIGVLLVIMGTVFSLLGNIGSIISFVIAMIVVGYMINSVRHNKIAKNCYQ
jgi:hypothetical protein